MATMPIVLRDMLPGLQIVGQDDKIEASCDKHFSRSQTLFQLHVLF